ncbi:hypothetical protein [Flavobacterium sp. 14A]|uniref:hypothetical protein n=1 Tax=Flavobacterium sp. 14A TaxID=2735896 RepID=UPI00156F4149|nr:hypothetical protein [Flavobacterium sp. 14A]NRT13622.1 hypothetical protein [Flavobacterium sp. 14A]
MDSKILLGKILQRFSDMKSSQIEDYNSFGYIRETNNAVYVSRENGKDTRIPFDKLIIGIDAYKEYPNLYLEGPNALRQFEIKYITSPVWSLLHLLTQENYKLK